MNARLNRLFAADGRCFDVAVDHGFFDEGSFLPGIEDMARTVAPRRGRPGCVQLSPGQAPLLQSVPGPAKPLVLRTDVANVYGAWLPAASSARSLERQSSSAVRPRRGLCGRQSPPPPGAARAARAVRSQRFRPADGMRRGRDAAHGRAARHEAGRRRLRRRRRRGEDRPARASGRRAGRRRDQGRSDRRPGGLSARDGGGGRAGGARTRRRRVSDDEILRRTERSWRRAPPGSSTGAT